MSICLPELRSTSVFKVYYGGTGQTTLTQGGVVIGNGTSAVQCITGSEGQVLTWDSTSGSWVAKNPTGGTGTGVGNVPDIVIVPENNTPSEVIKKRFSNLSYKDKLSLIDWNNNSNGSYILNNNNHLLEESNFIINNIKLTNVDNGVFISKVQIQETFNTYVDTNIYCFSFSLEFFMCQIFH